VITNLGHPDLLKLADWSLPMSSLLILQLFYIVCRHDSTMQDIVYKLLPHVQEGMLWFFSVVILIFCAVSHDAVTVKMLVQLHFELKECFKQISKVLAVVKASFSSYL